MWRHRRFLRLAHGGTYGRITREHWRISNIYTTWKVGGPTPILVYPWAPDKSPPSSFEKSPWNIVEDQRTLDIWKPQITDVPTSDNHTSDSKHTESGFDQTNGMEQGTELAKHLECCHNTCIYNDFLMFKHFLEGMDDEIWLYVRSDIFQHELPSDYMWPFASQYCLPLKASPLLTGQTARITSSPCWGLMPLVPLSHDGL